MKHKRSFFTLQRRGRRQKKTQYAHTTEITKQHKTQLTFPQEKQNAIVAVTIAMFCKIIGKSERLSGGDVWV